MLAKAGPINIGVLPQVRRDIAGARRRVVTDSSGKRLHRLLLLLLLLLLGSIAPHFVTALLFSLPSNESAR